MLLDENGSVKVGIVHNSIRLCDYERQWEKSYPQYMHVSGWFVDSVITLHYVRIALALLWEIANCPQAKNRHADSRTIKAVDTHSALEAEQAGPSTAAKRSLKHA